jgi:hypothetical protein
LQPTTETSRTIEANAEGASITETTVDRVVAVQPVKKMLTQCPTEAGSIISTTQEGQHMASATEAKDMKTKNNEATTSVAGQEVAKRAVRVENKMVTTASDTDDRATKEVTKITVEVDSNTEVEGVATKVVASTTIRTITITLMLNKMASFTLIKIKRHFRASSSFKLFRDKHLKAETLIPITSKGSTRHTRSILTSFRMQTTMNSLLSTNGSLGFWKNMSQTKDTQYGKNSAFGPKNSPKISLRIMIREL